LSEGEKNVTEDELIERAKKVSRKVGYVSVSYLQRNMRIGYTRAASLVDKLVAEGFCEKEPTAWRYDVTAEQCVHTDPPSALVSAADSTNTAGGRSARK
jgi:DNA segregation ATPase FtsK/SpoIIIE-like protein